METIADILSLGSSEMQDYLLNFGADQTDAYTFVQNLAHKRFESQLMEEHALKVHQKHKDDNFPKLKGMTARQKHDYNLKQEKERAAQNRQEAAGKSFFCNSQAAAIATGGPASDSGKQGKIVERRICLCQGVQHGALSNCLHCGKINCKEEGYGPCLFCGNPLDFESPGARLIAMAQTRTDEE
ncbi:unnamed protein product, partial [Amoebophrya sp. A25]|eukprot:GSA25T00011263001.1